jgi:integrase
MTRAPQRERARDRILADHETRLVWSKAEGSFGDLVKLLLLTAQRRETVASMKWSDISEDGVWTIPNGNRRKKGTGGELVLSEMALEIIRGRPRFTTNPYVFATRANTYLRQYYLGMNELNEATGPLPRWVLHDLRRTARSLMSRAGIRSDIAERVLGHVIGGVEGVYDRHQYREEKAHALRALASLIDTIVNPPAANVASLVRQ